MTEPARPDPTECDHGRQHVDNGDGTTAFVEYRPDAAQPLTDWERRVDPLTGVGLDGEYADAYCPICDHTFTLMRGVE